MRSIAWNYLRLSVEDGPIRTFAVLTTDGMFAISVAWVDEVALGRPPTDGDYLEAGDDGLFVGAMEAMPGIFVELGAHRWTEEEVDVGPADDGAVAEELVARAVARRDLEDALAILCANHWPGWKRWREDSDRAERQVDFAEVTPPVGGES